MKNAIRYFSVMVLLLAVSTRLFAEEAKAAAPDTEEKAKGGVSTSASVGSVTMGDEQWTRISIRPDIPIWKFGICLDLELFINSDGDIDKTGWQFDNAQQAWNSIQRKIYYVRFGHPGETFYGKVGSLDQVTLGYGLLVNGYTNALQYPEIRKMGMHLQLNKLGKMKFGTHVLVNNFQDFQNDGALFGVRTFLNPLGATGLPLLNKLQVGASYITDMNQYAGLLDKDDDNYPDLVDDFPLNEGEYRDSDNDGSPDGTDIDDDQDGILDQGYFDPATEAGLPDSLIDRGVTRKHVREYGELKNPVSAIGLDLGLPIIEGKFLNLSTYGQYGQMLGEIEQEIDSTIEKTDIRGFGIAFPGVVVGLGPLKVNLEYRYFKNMFLSEYFDQTYELDRAYLKDDTLRTKEEQLLDTDSLTKSGVFAGAEFNLFNLIIADASYQYMTVTSERADAGVPSSDQSAEGTLRFGETIMSLLKKVKVADIYGYYYKRNIGTTPVVVNPSADNNEVREYDSFLEPTPTSLFGYKFGFEISSGVVLYWNTQFTYEYGDLDESTGEYDFVQKKRTNVETVMQF